MGAAPRWASQTERRMTIPDPLERTARVARPRDWADLGARIRRAATIATTAHMMAQAKAVGRQTAEPVDSKAHAGD